MSWALTYRIKLKRPLTSEEQSALEDWSRQHRFRLSPTQGSAYDAWKGLLPDEQLEKLKRSYQERTPERDADYSDFIQLRTESHLKTLVRKFQKLEALLPDAEILLDDDYYLRDDRPSSVDLSGALVPRMDEPATPEPYFPAPREPAAPPESRDPDEVLVNEVASALERAQREFERWKKSRPK